MLFSLANDVSGATVLARSVASLAWHSSTVEAVAELTPTALNASTAARIGSKRTSFTWTP